MSVPTWKDIFEIDIESLKARVKSLEDKLSLNPNAEGVSANPLLSDVADLSKLFLSDLNDLLKKYDAKIFVTTYRDGGYEMYVDINTKEKIIKVVIDECDY